MRVEVDRERRSTCAAPRTDRRRTGTRGRAPRSSRALQARARRRSRSPWRGCISRSRRRRRARRARCADRSRRRVATARRRAACGPARLARYAVAASSRDTRVRDRGARRRRRTKAEREVVIEAADPVVGRDLRERRPCSAIARYIATTSSVASSLAQTSRRWCGRIAWTRTSARSAAANASATFGSTPGERGAGLRAAQIAAAARRDDVGLDLRDALGDRGVVRRERRGARGRDRARGDSCRRAPSSCARWSAARAAIGAGASGACEHVLERGARRRLRRRRARRSRRRRTRARCRRARS